MKPCAVPGCVSFWRTSPWGTTGWRLC